MNKNEITKFLINLKEDIGQTQYRGLWHYEQALDAAIEYLQGPERRAGGDVQPVRRGKWIDRGRKIACSVCNGSVYLGTDEKYIHEMEKKNLKFCPNCGADMGGEKE